MKGSLIAVLFFTIGLTAGHCDYLPTWTTDSRISFAALCGLLLFVGIGIGLNPNMKNDIKSLSPRLALLPIATILGSWLGAMAAISGNKQRSMPPFGDPQHNRLHGHKQWFCLLLTLKHLHHRISWGRTRHHSITGKCHP